MRLRDRSDKLEGQPGAGRERRGVTPGWGCSSRAGRGLQQGWRVRGFRTQPDLGWASQSCHPPAMQPHGRTPPNTHCCSLFPETRVAAPQEHMHERHSATGPGERRTWINVSE